MGRYKRALTRANSVAFHYLLGRHLIPLKISQRTVLTP